MTTNDHTEDPGSETNLQTVPASEQIEADVDMDKKEDADQPSEELDKTQFQPQQLDDRTEADQAKDELTRGNVDPGLAEKQDNFEQDVGRLLEEEETRVPEQGFKDRDENTNTETAAPDEENAKQPVPAISKEAVQDPGVVDINPITADNAVIDVDTFDDDVSLDDEASPSPVGGDETMEELETANESSLGVNQHLVSHDPRSEAIDLTASPLTQRQKDRRLTESDVVMAEEGRTAIDRHETLHGEDVIDVDEPEENEESATAIDAEDRQFDEEVGSPPVDEDENHVKGNNDTETASAELKLDTNGQDVSSGDGPVDSNAFEAAADGETETGSLLERSRAAEHSEEHAPMALERGNDSGDDEVEAEELNDTSLKDSKVEVAEQGAGKPEIDNGEGQVAQDESEDYGVDESGASGRNEAEHEETEEEKDESPSEAADRGGVKNEQDEKKACSDQHEVEEGQGQDSSSQGASRQRARGVPVQEDTSQMKQTDAETPDASNGDILPMDGPIGDNLISATVVRARGQVEGKKEAELDASAVGARVVQDMTEVGSEAPNDEESHAAFVDVTPHPGSHRVKEPNELRPSAPSSDHRDGDTRDSGTDIVMGSAENEKKVSAAPPFTEPAEAEAMVHPLTQRGKGSSKVKKQEDGKAEEPSVNLSKSFGASEEVKHASALREKSSAEESNKTSAGHLAPMFGIQLSRPVKSGPVSFSSPTSFPRYSLNPQATPFLPTKLRKAESIEQPTDSSKQTTGVSTPPNATQVVEAGSQHEAVQGHGQPKSLDVDDLAGKIVQTEQISSLKENSFLTDARSQVSTDKVPLPVALTEAHKDVSNESSTQRAPEATLAFVPKPTLKKVAPKKVSFAPTAVEIADRSMEPEKEHAAGIGTIGVVQKEETADEPTVQSTQPDTEAESEKHLKADKQSVEADSMKDKQTILQVQTDEGLRREVTNVTVAMRQGNSKVRPERKKFTVRLTTRMEGKAKLQFFKTTGSSLKLYASLDSSKDNLRVRKVTNRQYVMSVAKVAPPNDDASNIIVKYFLHFDERDTFEEMYSQCVSNLQRQPKPVVGTKETDGNSKSSKIVVKETKQDSSQLSSKSTGIKRAAETVNATQISKKSKLLADKKKLLDKMAALRRKKEQKGLSVKNEGQTQPGTEASSGVPSSPREGDKSSVQSGALKRKEATNPEVEVKNVGTPAPTLKESTQLLRKRTAEQLSNENASKKARAPSLHSGDRAAGAVRVPHVDGRSTVAKISTASMRRAAEEGLKGHNADIENSPPAEAAKSPKFHAEVSQQRSDEHSVERMVPGTNALAQQKSREKEALAKMTKNLKQAQEEKDALKHELDSRNRLLESEREKASRIQRENSDAWERIVKTVEALSADMSRLRREDTDRSLESLTRCEASSSEDFFDRLHSFRPSTWAAFENSEIGALECALRGWHNSGPGNIRSSEGSEVTLSENFDDAIFRQSEVERVRSLLREGHCLLSGWTGQACPDSFRTLEGSQRLLSKEQLRANVEGLRAGLSGSETKYDWGASALLLSDDVCEKLAVYNWSMDGECLRCAWCNRRAVIDVEDRFDAQAEHYVFCPFRAEDWKASVLRNAATLGIEGDTDAAMKG